MPLVPARKVRAASIKTIRSTEFLGAGATWLPRRRLSAWFPEISTRHRRLPRQCKLLLHRLKPRAACQASRLAASPSRYRDPATISRTITTNLPRHNPGAGNGVKERQKDRRSVPGRANQLVTSRRQHNASVDRESSPEQVGSLRTIAVQCRVVDNPFSGDTANRRPRQSLVTRERRLRLIRYKTYAQSSSEVR